MSNKTKYKACSDCISNKGICVYCDNGNCYSEPVKPVRENVSISNYGKFELFENEDLENDFPIEHWANDDLNDILYGCD
jgi:hypothetical protein